MTVPIIEVAACDSRMITVSFTDEKKFHNLFNKFRKTPPLKLGPPAELYALITVTGRYKGTEDQRHKVERSEENELLKFL